MSSRVINACAWLRLARLSNAPTCVSNVAVGAGIAVASGSKLPSATSFILVSASTVLLYVGGIVLNDVIDADSDTRERPGRPIPSGAVGRPAAGYAAVVLLIAGTGGLIVLGAGAWATLLLGAIVAYDLLHGCLGAAALLMGACRGLAHLASAVAFAGSAALDWTYALPIAAGMAGYVTLLTLIARREAAGDPGPWARAVWLMPVLGCGPAFVVGHSSLLFAIAAALLVAWLTVGNLQHVRAGRMPLVSAIGWWVAVIALVDTVTLVRLGLPSLAVVAAAAWCLTVLGQRYIQGS